MMLTDADVFFPLTVEARDAAMENLAVGELLVIPSPIAAIWSSPGKLEVAKRIPTYQWFVEILVKSKTIECVNEDCSLIRFIDNSGNELAQWQTTSELGSILSSNPKITYGEITFTKS